MVEAFGDEASWLLPLSRIVLHRSNHDDEGVSGAEVDTADTRVLRQADSARLGSAGVSAQSLLEAELDIFILCDTL